MNYLILIFLLLLLGLSACVEPVGIPLRSGSQRLVVEGIFTNEAEPCTVKLSYSQDINALKNITYVSNAKIRITDDRGNHTDFREVSTPFPYYLSTNRQFVGVIGRTYTLSIELPDGKKFVSRPETMQSVPSIDNISVEFDNSTKSFNGNKLFGYKVYLDTQDPIETGNYYRWSAYTYAFKQTRLKPCAAFSPPICRDYYWCRENEQDIIIGSDVGLNGNPIKKQYVHFSPVYILGQSYVEVRQQAISREIYQYWKNYIDQTLRTGSIFDPIPSTIVGNVYNPNNPNEFALGYFSVASVSVKRFIINSIDMPNGRNLIGTYGNKYDSSPCPEGTIVYTNNPPPGW
ncbi:MAG: DUF4249 domain-containing protein [Thermoflexibacter sp.]|nr:DUF4249 domain-containing protein [Thermoflexibacter sp.]